MAKTRDLFAACRDGKLQTVQRLVQSKKVFPSAAVDERYNDFTALHHAAANGHLGIVQYLISYCHCDVNAKDSYHGKTPLHYAAENGHLPVVKYLVGQKECSFDLKSNVGKVPMKYASDNGHGAVAAFLAEHRAKKEREERAESSLKSSDKAGGTQLSEDDLGNLFDHLNPHAAKWRTIGTNLGFHPAELDNIQSKTMLIPEAPSSFLNELLSQWLQWAPDPANRASKRNYATLGTLQSAVRRAGLGRVAAELKME